ncbi:hypothetical protein BKP43_38290 [Variovorax boronicumulans]|uniref:hypothetical protein n=1 Tax=Variovorax boronicumulans TaxID=436515 RepID=UPI000BB2FE60|nr:hypothetical protein [Variovorax boronicumulans]PBI87763.1 hypothetical protein BKP43_38290 [Variovorax boronicumulans]
MNLNQESGLPAANHAKPPLKANVYHYAQMAGTQLLPLFPYHNAGDIVPACSSIRSHPDGPAIGYFLHANDVDELMVSFGSSGDIRSGDARVEARNHGVGGWGVHSEFFAVMCITQRQVESGPQQETIGFNCEKCSQEVSRLDFSGTPHDQASDAIPALPTILGSAKSAAMFNASEASRTCKACGHLNQAFPAHIWGWSRYAFNTAVVEDARMALKEAAR